MFAPCFCCYQWVIAASVARLILPNYRTSGNTDRRWSCDLFKVSANWDVCCDSVSNVAQGSVLGPPSTHIISSNTSVFCERSIVPIYIKLSSKTREWEGVTPGRAVSFNLLTPSQVENKFGENPRPHCDVNITPRRRIDISGNWNVEPRKCFQYLTEELEAWRPGAYSKNESALPKIPKHCVFGKAHAP
jgi:hypothetical protein